MKRLMEQFKIDTAIVPQAMSITNYTSSYYAMDMYNEASIHLSVGEMAATKKARIEIYQAKDANGTDAEIVKDANGTDIKSEITANTKVRKVKIALASVGAADKVTINGVEYTKDTTSAADKKFNDAAGLISCIEYHQPHLKATAVSTDVFVEYANPGEGTITATGTNVGGTVAVSTESADALLSMLQEYMKTNEGFTHLAVKVTTDASTIVSAQMLRGNSERYSPIQAVGASVMVK